MKNQITHLQNKVLVLNFAATFLGFLFITLFFAFESFLMLIPMIIILASFAVIAEEVTRLETKIYFLKKQIIF